MTYFTSPDFGAFAAKAITAIRRVIYRRSIAKAEAARADEAAKAKAEAARAHAAAMAEAEAEASQDARLKAIMAPLWEGIERVHAKLDAILAKLE